MELLASRNNPQAKKLYKLLSQKKERARTGFFVCEGARLCSDVAESKVDISRAFITENAMRKYPDETRKIISKAKRCWLITDELSEWLSDTKGPQGIFIIGRKLDNSFDTVTITNNGYYVIIDNIQDSGNVGTILRTAFSLGVNAVFLSADSAELYSPKTLRASMGSAVKLPIVVIDNVDECINNLQTSGIKVYATALTSNSKPISRSLFNNGSAILMGNEGAGLSSERIELCDDSLMIPMSLDAESLNVAVAAGIFIWEMVSGRLEE